MSLLRLSRTMELTRSEATTPLPVPSPDLGSSFATRNGSSSGPIPTSDGGFLLTCDGVSDLVRGRSALFLTELEDEIEVLDPANTVLVPDTSAGPTTTHCCTWRATGAGVSRTTN